ncbi:MAG: carboxymuconolactone decarboxylase family protein [Microthrixaceae bacterium]
MTVEDVLRVLALGDLSEKRGGWQTLSAGVGTVDERTQAAAEIAALAALGARDASFAVAVDRAIGAGLTANDLVALILGLIPTVGSARLVDIAPALASGWASISTSCWSYAVPQAPVHNPDGRGRGTTRSCASSEKERASRLPRVVST